MHRRPRHGLDRLFWAFCATAVMAFIALAALGALEPGEAIPLTVAVLALAVLWLAHEWLGLWRDERR